MRGVDGRAYAPNEIFDETRDGDVRLPRPLLVRATGGRGVPFDGAACRAPRAPGRRRGCRVCCVSDASRPVMMCVRGGRGSTSRASPRVGAARTWRWPWRAPAAGGPPTPEPAAAVAAAPPPHQFAARATRTTSFPRAVLFSLAARRRLFQSVLERPIVLGTH